MMSFNKTVSQQRINNMTCIYTSCTCITLNNTEYTRASFNYNPKESNLNPTKLRSVLCAPRPFLFDARLKPAADRYKASYGFPSMVRYISNSVTIRAFSHPD